MLWRTPKELFIMPVQPPTAWLKTMSRLCWSRKPCGMLQAASCRSTKVIALFAFSTTSITQSFNRVTRGHNCSLQSPVKKRCNGEHLSHSKRFLCEVKHCMLHCEVEGPTQKCNLVWNTEKAAARHKINEPSEYASLHISNYRRHVCPAAFRQMQKFNRWIFHAD